MNGIYLIIGGNIGNRAENLSICREMIANEIGPLQQSSSLYETASWGNENEAAYLNQVLFLQTNKSAGETLICCLSIEKKMGRVRQIKWESRLIDIDILFFNQDIIYEPNLKIPHPHIQKRKFVLIPLNEIASGFIHPVLHKKISQLLHECDDKLEVRIVSNDIYEK